MPRRTDRGQAVLLVVVVVVILVVVTAAAARFGVRLIAIEQAQIAADTAALAGVEGGARDTRRLAEANGGALVSYVGDAWTVTVVVRHGDAVATARASRAP